MKRAAAVILSLLILLTGCANQKHSLDFFAMDTVMRVTVYGTDATDKVRGEIERLDTLLSVTNEQSDISKYNRGEKISDEAQALVDRSAEISELTGGAFDISLQALVELWNIPDGDRVPTDSEIQAALTDKSRIGLGAIAKGYAASQVRKLLKNEGVKSAVCSLGGNVMVIGSDIDGSDWNVGIQHPLHADRLIASVYVSDTAVVTSGGYQRYFEKDGQIYHHIFDPQTGYPAQSGIISATVITEDDTLADALSTAIYVMGVEKATELYRAVDAEFLMVTEDTVYITKGLKSRFALEDNEFNIKIIE